VSYQDSGTDWLGRIPSTWSVKKLKFLCTRSALYGANEPADSYVEKGVRFLRTSDITEDGHLLDEGAVFLPAGLVQDYLLSDGDILFSRSGTLGRSFLYGAAAHGPCAYAGYLVRFVPSKYLVPRFAFYFSKSARFAGWLDGISITTTIGNVNGQKFANLQIPTPSVTEQRAIVTFLDRETTRIDELISKKKTSDRTVGGRAHRARQPRGDQGSGPPCANQGVRGGVDWAGACPLADRPD